MREQEYVAYLAGLFDAEGSILIEKKAPRWSNKSVRYILTVTLTNTRIELVRLAYVRYGGRIVGPIHQASNHRPFYRWSLSGAQARKFLQEIEPYVIVKRERLKLACELQDRIENYHHKPLAAEEINAREEIFQRFRNIQM
jgi:hypothetical protein